MTSYERPPLPKWYAEILIACVVGAFVAWLWVGPRREITGPNEAALTHNLRLSQSMLASAGMMAGFMLVIVVCRDHFRFSLRRLAEVMLVIIAILFLWQNHRRAAERMAYYAEAIAFEKAISAFERALAASTAAQHANKKKYFIGMDHNSNQNPKIFSEEEIEAATESLRLPDGRPP